MALVRRPGRIGIEELADRYAVSPTIRKHLEEPGERRVVTRIHGGALLASGVADLGYDARRARAADAERRIAARVAELVPKRSSLFLTIATTAEEVARALVGHDDLLVATNNVHAVAILLLVPGIELVVTGGAVRKPDGRIVGEAVAGLVSRYRLDYAVSGARAIDLDGALLDVGERHVDVGRAVVARARHVVLVADGTEFASSVSSKITGLERIRIVETHCAPPAAFFERAAAAATRVEILGAVDEHEPDRSE